MESEEIKCGNNSSSDWCKWKEELNVLSDKVEIHLAPDGRVENVCNKWNSERYLQQNIQSKTMGRPIYVKT